VHSVYPSRLIRATTDGAPFEAIEWGVHDVKERKSDEFLLGVQQEHQNRRTRSKSRYISQNLAASAAEFSEPSGES
jgi:hypothetical protein